MDAWNCGRVLDCAVLSFKSIEWYQAVVGDEEGRAVVRGFKVCLVAGYGDVLPGLTKGLHRKPMNDEGNY